MKGVYFMRENMKREKSEDRESHLYHNTEVLLKRYS